MSNVLILVGSLRKQGNSRILAESLAEGSKENNDVEIHRNMEKTDVLVIASPVYFYGISSSLKAVMGRLHTPLRDTFYIKGPHPSW